MAMEFLSSINVCSIVSGVTVCGGTKVCSPIIAGTTCVTSPITIGTTCVCSPIVLGSTCACSPIICGSTCAISPIICGTSCVKAPILQLTSVSAKSTETAAAFFNSAGCLLSGTSTGGGMTWSGSTANGVGTYVNATSACSQPNMTFDGSILCLAGNIAFNCSATRCITMGSITTGTPYDLNICGESLYKASGSADAKNIVLYGGDASGTTIINAGGVCLIGGNARTSGTNIDAHGGDIFLKGGCGCGKIPDITQIRGGNLYLCGGGAVVTSGSSAGGCVQLIGGCVAGSCSFDAGGTAYVYGGNSTSGLGGHVIICGGTGAVCNGAISLNSSNVICVNGNMQFSNTEARCITMGTTITNPTCGLYICGTSIDSTAACAGGVTIIGGCGKSSTVANAIGGTAILNGGTGWQNFTGGTSCGGTVCVYGGSGYASCNCATVRGGNLFLDGGGVTAGNGLTSPRFAGCAFLRGGSVGQDYSVAGNVYICGGCSTLCTAGNIYICNGLGVTKGNLYINNLPAKSTETCVLYIDSVGKISSGTTSGGIAWAGTTANGVGTYVSATCACSQPNLTFDGSSLGLTGNIVFTKGATRYICWDADATAHGSAIVICGNNGAATKNGGSIQLCGGQGGTTPSIGGHIVIEAGGGVTNGGSITLCGGAGTTTGCITMLHSAVEVFKTIPTGVQVLCNFAMTTGAARSICFDTASAGIGSALSIIGNTGLACAGSAVACKGGAICIIGGAGGANSGTGCGGTGSTVYICGGTAGAGTGTTKAGFAGHLCLSAGQSVSSSSNKEGTIYLGSNILFSTPTWNGYSRTIGFVPGGATGCGLQILGQSGTNTGGVVCIQGGGGNNVGGEVCILGGSAGANTGSPVCIQAGNSNHTYIYGGVKYSGFGGNVYLKGWCGDNADGCSPYNGVDVIAGSCVSLYFCGVERLKTLTNGVCARGFLDVSGITGGVGLCVRGGCGVAIDWAATSDCRLKTDIAPISNALSIVTHLQGVRYHWCDDVCCECHLGFIAQDVEKVLPEIVSHSAPSEEDGKYGITDDKLGLKYDKITAVLVEAIKEQQKQIHCLCSDLNYIRNEYYKNTK